MVLSLLRLRFLGILIAPVATARQAPHPEVSDVFGPLLRALGGSQRCVLQYSRVRASQRFNEMGGPRKELQPPCGCRGVADERAPGRAREAQAQAGPASQRRIQRPRGALLRGRQISAFDFCAVLRLPLSDRNDRSFVPASPHEFLQH